MKNKALTLTLVILFVSTISSLAAFQKLEGETFTKFGTYVLTETDNFVVINNVAYKTWDLTYANNDQKYQVLIAPGQGKDCCFVVRGENFEIQYARQGNEFGVNLVDQERRTLKKKEVMSQINPDNFTKQSVLTTSEKTVEEYLGLVACFMPLLFS